jgi:outer membrane protein, multidrug efflux system
VTGARAAVVGVIAALLAGCAVGPDYRAPAPPAVERFGQATQLPTAAGEIDRRWWQVFGDPQLDELVGRAVAANQDLAAANARLREARASRREQFFDLLPTVTSTASYQERRSSLGSVPGGFPILRDLSLYDAGFDATWELDLFGRTRRLNQSARAAAEAAIASRDDVQRSVVAEVARNYFELRGAQSRLAVAQRNAETQSRVLELVRQRFDAGRGTGLDTARAEAVVATTLATVPPLEATVVRAMHRIEVLTGEVPGALADSLAAEAPLPALPATVALGDPAQLLRRRPDVRAAERQLAAATARIGVAVADLFPRVTVNGSIGLQALTVDRLDDSRSDRRSFGPSLSWAFLDYGRIRQRINAAGARTDAALAQYQQSVLVALEETENALSDYGRERRRVALLERAAEQSVIASDLATQRFEVGVADFLTALDAYRTALEAEDLLAESRTRAATNLVSLFKALAGGWETAAEPAPAPPTPEVAPP